MNAAKSKLEMLSSRWRAAAEEQSARRVFERRRFQHRKKEGAHRRRRRDGCRRRAAHLCRGERERCVGQDNVRLLWGLKHKNMVGKKVLFWGCVGWGRSRKRVCVCSLPVLSSQRRVRSRCFARMAVLLSCAQQQRSSHFTHTHHFRPAPPVSTPPSPSISPRAARALPSAAQPRPAKRLHKR